MSERLDVRHVAQGRWRSILAVLGADEKTLSGKHGPCPMCGGRDRFRFDDKEGRFELGSLLGRYAYHYRTQPDLEFQILGINWDYRHKFHDSKLEFYTNGEYGYPFFAGVDFALEAEAGLRYSLSESLRLTFSTELDALQGEIESHNDWRHVLGIGYSWK